MRKPRNLTDLLPVLNDWKKQGEKIVFTNGCFDILHKGHITYLRQAKKLGSKLIVGLNSDASVKTLGKGAGRPIQSENDRLYILIALEMVDAVVVFNDETPLELIETIIPDTLVKGGDWKPEDIVGSEIVVKNGGQVLSLSFVEGYSTTEIESRIRKASS